MSDKFDVVVIGSGPGGYIAALKAAQLGAKTAVVEKSHFGGTCLNNGCIPSKALLATSQLLNNIEHAKGMGVSIDGKVSFDWTAVQKRKDKVLAKLRGGIKGLLGARKVTVLNGIGKLAGKGKFTVTSGDGKTKTYEAGKIILAVGSVPSRVPVWPDDPNFVCTSDESLHWDKLPQKLLIVGGGVIGCEFACMMQPLGVEVTLVEMMPRLLPEMEEELAGELDKIFKSRKIDVYTDTKVESLAIAGKGIKAVLSNGKTVEADKCLVATGRRPATEDIGLETVGIETDRGFIRVDDKMQTTAEGVYCIGDANGRCLLAHAASAHGVVAAENACGHETELDASMPWAVYTFPEIAGVGLTEKRAIEKGIKVSVGMFPIGHLGKAMAANHSEGFAKVIRDRETDAIVGVHMIGHNATEVIAAAGGLISTKATTTEMAETVFAHPTISEALKESAEDALGMALHLPPRKVIKIAAE